MKKKIISILALVLVIVTAVVLCTSCAKKEAVEETAKMSITIVNQTGETAKDLTLKEQKGAKPQEWGQGELADGQEITINIETVVENGAPFLNVSYALENGDNYRNYQTSIMTRGDKVLTLKLDAEGSPTIEEVTK